MRCTLLCSLVTLLSTGSAFAQGDPAVIQKIIKEGKDNSRVWVYETFLAEEIGPRLTGSARLERANNWTRDMFESFGCTNAHLMKWDEIAVRFDRGPSRVRITKPIEQDLVFTARSWSAGTDGPIKGKVLKQPANMEDLEAMKDQLQGAWVLAKPPAPRARRGVVNRDAPPGPGGGSPTPGGPPAAAPDAPPIPGNRDDNAPAAGGRDPNAPPAGDANAPPRGDRNAQRDPNAPPPAGGPDAAGQRGGGGGGGRGGAPQRDEVVEALYAAGIAGRIMPSNSDLVLTGGSWRDVDFDNLPKNVSVTIRRADYDMLNSRLADGESVELEVDLDHRFSKGPFPLYNTVAEIPGTEFPEQVVIVSAHLDSWDGPGSQGAQDNGTGTSVTLEAARILMAAGAQPRRTIRFCLWTGEEQGLLGSRGYVESLSDEEKANISAVLVDDGGTNYQGGLVCVADMEAMLKTATEPVNGAFRDMPVDIIVRERMPQGGGSDHASFNRVGIPGFFWEEDGLGGREGKNYNFVHHTQHDTTRYAVPEYLVQSATCSAVTAYNLAMADTLLPRYVAPPPPPEDTSPFTPTPGPLTGTWAGTMIRDGQPSEFTTTFTLEHSTEGKIRGRMYSGFGDSPIRGITYNSDTGEVVFRIESERGASTYKMTLKGDEMNGEQQREGRDPIIFNAKRETTDIRPPATPEGERGGAGAGGAGAGAGRGAGGS